MGGVEPLVSGPNGWAFETTDGDLRLFEHLLSGEWEPVASQMSAAC